MLVPGLTGSPRKRRTRWRSWEGGATRSFDKVFGPIWRFLPASIGVVGLLYVVAPVVVSIPLSFGSSPYLKFPPTGFSWQWYRSYLRTPEWIQATLHSFEIAGGTVVVAVVLSLTAAVGLVRLRSRWSAPIYLMVISPLIVPEIITAIATFFWLSNLKLTGTLLGVVLGDTVRAIPLACIVLVGALQTFDPNLEKAAHSLGAGSVRTFRRVTLPLLKTAIVSAAVFVFIYAFDELLIAFFVSGVTTSTLSKKMWESLQEIDPTITAVSSLLVGMAIVVVLGLAGIARLGSRGSPKEIVEQR